MNILNTRSIFTLLTLSLKFSPSQKPLNPKLSTDFAVSNILQLPLGVRKPLHPAGASSNSSASRPHHDEAATHTHTEIRSPSPYFVWHNQAQGLGTCLACCKGRRGRRETTRQHGGFGQFYDKKALLLFEHR